MLTLGARSERGEFVSQKCAQLRDLLGWELNRRVVGDDRFLDELDAQRALFAAVRALLPADADEVGVDAASALCVVDDQPAPTCAADAALTTPVWCATAARSTPANTRRS